MPSAKDIEVRPIARRDADAIVKRVHYSGSVVQNSQVNLGVFLGGRCLGAMQFGPPLDRRKILPIVKDAPWESVIELNRMAFDDELPRNSESRALAVAFRMFKAKAPQVRWIVSFADGCQCGDGTIYRASGFLLTGIKEAERMWRLPDGRSVCQVTYDKGEWAARNGGAASGARMLRSAGAVQIPGFQFRYIRFLDESWRSRLTVSVIPFDKIPDAARMYRGARQPVGGSGVHLDKGGAGPTLALHSETTT